MLPARFSERCCSMHPNLPGDGGPTTRHFSLQTLLSPFIWQVAYPPRKCSPVVQRSTAWTIRPTRFDTRHARRSHARRSHRRR